MHKMRINQDLVCTITIYCSVGLVEGREARVTSTSALPVEVLGHAVDQVRLLSRDRQALALQKLLELVDAELSGMEA